MGAELDSKLQATYGGKLATEIAADLFQAYGVNPEEASIAAAHLLASCAVRQWSREEAIEKFTRILDHALAARRMREGHT